MNIQIPAISMLAASAFVSVVGFANTANAAIFSFSFNNEDGPVDGVVEGTVELPDGDGTFSATAVTINSFPVELELPSPPLETLNFGSPDNTFTVAGGEIIEASFFGLINGETSLSFSSSFPPNEITYLDFFNAGDFGETGVRDDDSSTLVFTRASVSTPEPASVLTLVGLGLFGIAGKFSSKRFE